MCKGLAHGEEERQIIPADSMAANSFLADSSFSESRRRALAKTGGPGDVGTVWQTGCLGSVVKKPLEETTSGYSDRRLRNSSGVERRAGSRFQVRGVKETRTCNINQEVIVA